MKLRCLVVFLLSVPVAAGAASSEFEFMTDAVVSSAQAVYVYGDLEELGAWNTEHALKLVREPNTNIWRLRLALPGATAFEYRYLVRLNSAARIADPANGAPLGPVLSATTAPAPGASGSRTVYLDSPWNGTPVLHWRELGRESFRSVKMDVAAIATDGITHVAGGLGGGPSLEFYLTDAAHSRRIPDAGAFTMDGSAALVAQDQVFGYLPADGVTRQRRAYPPAQPFTIDSVILNETRVYRVMLPRGYDQHPQRRYPLVLIHDGYVHWDDEFTTDPLDPDGIVSEWEVIRGAMSETIQVAVDPLTGTIGCAFQATRVRDYYPTGANVMIGGCPTVVGNFDAYADFLELELLPALADDYRIAAGPAISIGFSAGGLASLNLGVERPHFVNRAGSLSGAVWVNQFRSALQQAPTAMERIYLDSGTNGDLFETNQSLRDDLLGNPSGLVLGRELDYQVYPNGAHIIFDWRRRLGRMLSFLAPAAEAGDALPQVPGAEIAAGLWFDRARNGHGFDLHRAGDRYVLVFYTYGEDGLPEWFIATATVVGGALVSEDGLLRFTYDAAQPSGPIPDPTFSGDFVLDFAGAAADPACNDGTDRGGAPLLAVFSWQVRDAAGSWCVEPLVTQDEAARPNFGGLWYDPSDSGWGFSTHIRDAGAVPFRQLFSVLYFYDGDGQPRWSIGSATPNSGGALEMLSFTGYCPACEPVALAQTASGTLSLAWEPTGEFGVERRGFVNMTVTPGATPGTWSRTGTPVIQLSEPADPPVTPRGLDQRIAFVSDRDGNDEIYLIDADGLNPRRLTRHAGDDSGPSWSPNRDRIAFHSEREGEFAVFLMDPDGDDVERLTDHPAPEGLPAWSPDGRSIMFTSLRDDGVPNLFLITLDDRQVTRMTEHGALGGSWSPDGTEYVYQGVAGDDFDVFVLDVATGATRNLTNDAALDENPRWSPDGELIAFESQLDGLDDFFTIRPDGSGRTNRTNTPNRDEDRPTWSPDGTALVFRSNPGGEMEALMRMDLPSGRITRLTYDAHSVRDLAWR